MKRLRNGLADVLVGVVLLIGILWLLRGLLKTVYWGATTIALIVVVILVLRLASKLRGR